MIPKIKTLEVPRLKADVVRSSFAVMEPILVDMSIKFFELLREHHPQAANLFPSDADAENAQTLARSLDFIVENIDKPVVLRPWLEDVGRCFACQALTDAHYDWAIEAMLRTLTHYFHIGWSSEIRKQWILTFAICANAMKLAAHEVQLVPQVPAKVVD